MCVSLHAVVVTLHLSNNMCYTSVRVCVVAHVSGHNVLVCVRVRLYAFYLVCKYMYACAVV